MPHPTRPHTGIRSFMMVIGIALMLSALPVAAQSPEAEPVESGAGLAEHTIFAYACPAGFDPSAGTPQDAFDNCSQPQEGAQFTVTSQDPNYPASTRATDASGATGWSDLPGGVAYTIAQTTPEGYGDPWVYCRYFQELDGSGPGTEAFFQAAGGQMDVGLTDPSLTGYRDVTCNWFEVPSDTAAIAAETGGTRLDIRVWQCPFHFDAAAASVDQLVGTCNKPHRDANFIINGDPATQQYTGDIGATNYQNVPFGTVTIQQLAYASFDPVRVFCYTQPYTASHGPLQASQEIGFTEEPGDTFSVSINVNPGDAIDCIWFDAWITEDDLGTVLLHKYVCPDGTNTAGFDMDLLLHACAEPQVAYFQLLYPGGSSSGNETDSNGYLGFINYGPGSFTLREIAPMGYATARIFCRSYNADDWNHIVDPYIEQTVTNNNGFTVQIQAHWETECNWFDIKGVNYGYLDLTVDACPIGFQPTDTTPRLTYAQQCQTGISGAIFTISGEPDFELSATSADGYALFQEHVPAGYMTISSKGPQTYSLVNVFCGDAPFIGIGAIPTDWTAFPNGFVLYDVPVDYQVVCEFYYRPLVLTGGDAATSDDVQVADAGGGDALQASPEAGAAIIASPESGDSGTSNESITPGGTETSGETGTSGGTGETGSSAGATGGASQPPVEANAPATLTLVAFTCPPGYDLYAGGAAPSGDCPDPATGIDFTLTGQDGTSQQATSNAGGELSWTGLAPGSYLVQAALPPETARAFIADCTSDQRTFTVDNPLTPFAFAGPEGQIGITLLPGESLACSWYDIPAGQGGTVTVLTLSCPGTTVIEAQCTATPGPATLHFDPAPGETVAAFEVQVGDDGSGQVTAAEGAYLLTGVPTSACLVDSEAFDASGQLVVHKGEAVEVRVYICGVSSGQIPIRS